MVPSKVTPSLHLAAHGFIVNLVNDQNNYTAAVMMSKGATVVMGVAIKLAHTTMAI